MLMFLGITGLYFFMKHLQSLKKWYLLGTAFFFSVLFHTSYSAIPFIIFSQVLWFYQPHQEIKKPSLTSFITLNGLILLFCLPWIIFLGLHYTGQAIMDPFHIEDPGSLWMIMYRILNDWNPNFPLMIVSVMLLILSPVFSRNKKNAFLLIALVIFPIGCLYLYCKYFNVTHFFTSRYFINFLPLFLISTFLSLDAIENTLERSKSIMRLKFLFTILFIASNLIILPLYYHSQKQDHKGLVHFLRSHLEPGDKIFDGDRIYTPGILHYFGVYPENRHYAVHFDKFEGKVIGFKKPFYFKNHQYTIYYSNTCCSQYIEDGNRLWIVVGKGGAKEAKKNLPCVLMGHFDGSFLNYDKFPTDASIYLFLWDPKSPNEKGIDMPIE
jgi:hypothetical protein